MQAYEDGLCSDVIVSQSGREFKAIWNVSENCTDYTFSLGRLVGHDLSVPLKSIPAFMEAAGRALLKADPGARAYVFGHLGDGNLHYVVKTEKRDVVSPALYRIATSFGGSVTATCTTW